jgi:hypothetical protein
MLIEALHTDHPAADRAAGLALYGWLVERLTGPDTWVLEAEFFARRNR